MAMALLLIDIQEGAVQDLRDRAKDFEDSSDVLRIIDDFVVNVEDIAKACAEARTPVFHITTEFDEPVPVFTRRKLAMYSKGSSAAKEIECLSRMADEAGNEHHPRVIKQHYDAFSGTDIDAQLHGRGVDTLLVAGLYTHWCVLATVFGALSHGYRVCVLEDCVITERKHWDLGKMICAEVFNKRDKALNLCNSKTVISLLRATAHQAGRSSP